MNSGIEFQIEVPEHLLIFMQLDSQMSGSPAGDLYYLRNKTSLSVFYRRIKYSYEFGCI